MSRKSDTSRAFFLNVFYAFGWLSAAIIVASIVMSLKLRGAPFDLTVGLLPIALFYLPALLIIASATLLWKRSVLAPVAIGLTATGASWFAWNSIGTDNAGNFTEEAYSTTIFAVIFWFYFLFSLATVFNRSRFDGSRNDHGS